MSRILCIWLLVAAALIGVAATNGHPDHVAPQPVNVTAAEPSAAHEERVKPSVLATCGDNDDLCPVMPCTAWAHTYPCIANGDNAPTLPPSYNTYWGEYDGHQGCYAKLGDTSYVICEDGFREST